MAKSCSYIPTRKGVELKGFRTYRNELGYATAAEVFPQVLSPTFQEMFKAKLKLDDQGVPTYESAITVPHIRKVIGTSKLIQSEQKKFQYIPNTRENYLNLLHEALAYNTSSEMRDMLTAVVSASGDGSRIRVEMKMKDASSDNEFQNQYGAHMLNERLAQIFGDIGVTPELLERNEGTNGYVDFSKAASIADGFKGLINISNDMQGELALSEEFSHLLIGLFRNEPLVQRSLRQLMENESLAREILGDEYDRNAAYYSSHPTYNEAGEVMSLEETLAEEALGKLLQEKLKEKNKATPATDNAQKESSALRNLVDRLVRFIRNIFKGRNADEVTKATNDVNLNMGELARQVLSGEKKISREDISQTRRNARFHQVKEEVDSVLKLLNNATDIERKRTKIAAEDKVSGIKQRIIELEALINDEDKLIGVHTYAKWALSDLQDAMDALTITDTLETYDFRKLRHIKNVLDSYGGFIDEFFGILDELGNDAIISVNGEDVNLRELWNKINNVYKGARRAFNKAALAAFSDYLAPAYNRSPLRDKDGKIKSIEDVLTGEDFDISEIDRWCTSMGNSSSVILQAYDFKVKEAKDKIRHRTNKDIRKIWKLRDDAERRGITSFDWLYERDREGHKTGNYISEYNYGQYNKDKREMEENLVKKYGKTPVGKALAEAKAEAKAWYDAHAIMPEFGAPIPNDTYRNPAYAKLSKAQRDTLDEILEYKASKEKQIPESRRETIRAVQRRRSGFQRLTDSAMNLDQTFAGIQEAIQNTFNKKEDDDLLYGERTSGLTDFTGREYLTLPVMYTNRLKNPDELSTDIFGDLMLYSYMANSYEEMSNTYDPLEIGVSVLSNKDFVKNSGSKLKEEVINVMGKVTKRSVKTGNNTLFERKLMDYLECQVYGKYLKDEGEILGQDTQKTVSFLQKMTSTAFLGFNILAGIANVATAVGMQNIEAAAGEFFGAKELAKADWEYKSLLVDFMLELANRKKQSKLALFDELFNVKQDAKDKLHNVQLSNIIRRFFGKNWLFVQQGMGDHWIYNRTAIAMAMRTKVLVDGKKMSVWDALDIVTDENGYKTMVVKPGAKRLDEKGNVIGDFNASEFGREIASVNHDIVGIYNDDDQNAANRVAIGRLLQQMRKWIFPQFMKRFQSKRPSLIRGKEVEGYYRTFGRLLMDSWKAGFRITAEWDKLDDTEKANIRRVIAEQAQYWALWFIVMGLSGGAKEPDRTWKDKFFEYLANRELHELGFLAPSPSMPLEVYKTLTSPMVALSALNSVAQFAMSAANPHNWFPGDDGLIQSGPYKGHGYIYKRFMQLPIPPFTQIRQIDKFIDDLDTGTKYYSKDYR